MAKVKIGTESFNETKDEKTSEVSRFKIGDYNTVCGTRFHSPSDATSACLLTKNNDFRALFEFDVYKGKINKADATLHEDVFKELTPADDETKKEIADLQEFMKAEKLDRVTLTVHQTKEEREKIKGILDDVSEGLFKVFGTVGGA
jgi:hypothetical protein